MYIKILRDIINSTNQVEGNFDGLASGIFALGFIAVAADFIGDDCNGFGTDSSGDIVTLFNGDNELDGQFNISAGLGNGWCANVSGFNNIYDGAVMFWLFISVCWLMVSISWGWVSVSWGWVSVSWGGVTISWSWVSISWSWVGWHASHEGECKKCEKSLKVTNNMNEYEHDSGIYCNVWSNIIIYTISYSGYISNDNKNVVFLSMKW